MSTHRRASESRNRRSRRVLRTRLACLCLGAAALAPSSAIAHAQPEQRKTYSTPKEALRDLVAVATSNDVRRLRAVFGAEVARLVSADTVQQRAEFRTFVTRAIEFADAAEVSSDRYEIVIGNERWPFPVPLQRVSRGWQFDTEAGIEEILARRIGRNELNGIGVCEAFSAAQWDYFLDADWDHDQVHEFAQRFLSTEGRKDGLYWPGVAQAPPSPLGPLIALASDEGYSAAAAGEPPTAYQGYRFRVLTAQGPSAPGGAHGYLVNGNMINGFAVVAYPATYGVSGIMTFIVNQQGRVYERDLGEDTERIASSMDAYDPDPGWKPVARVR